MTDITAVSDISAVNHQSSDAEKYKILTASQSFDRKYEFPQTQFGMKSNGKPHMCSFSKNWLEEFGQDGLMYSVVEDAAYCKPKQKKLKQLCRTRWVERLHSYDNFWNLFEEVLLLYK